MEAEARGRGRVPAVAEEVSHRDLSTFFAQWLQAMVLYDYAVGRVKSRRRAAGTGRWRTRVEVVRRAPGGFRSKSR